MHPARTDRTRLRQLTDLPNIGQVPDLPPGTVVETAMRVDAGGFTPLASGPLPAAVLGLVEPWARTFHLAVEACLEGSLAAALQALRLDPVCAHLAGPRVEEMGRRLLRAHRRYLALPCP